MAVGTTGTTGAAVGTTGTRASDVMLVLASFFIVTVVYKYQQTVVYGDQDPNFFWNVVFRGKPSPYPQTTESQQWAFFFLSTINLLVIYLLIVVLIVLLSWIKEV